MTGCSICGSTGGNLRMHIHKTERKINLVSDLCDACFSKKNRDALLTERLSNQYPKNEGSTESIFAEKMREIERGAQEYMKSIERNQ